MEQPMVRVVYGLTLETGKLRAEIEQAAREAGVEIMPICRYRKEGIYQYMADQPESILILEENLQASSPYTDDDIVKISEEGNPHILFLLDEKHYGTDYMKTLYLSGILNAVFTQQATGVELVRLLISGRTNEEARNYYGIQLHRDAQKDRGEVNTEYLGTCLEYIEDSTVQSEMDSRYRFAASRLSPKENMVLIDSLSPEINRFLEGNEIYKHYQRGRERKGFFSRIGARKKTKEPALEVDGTGEEDTMPEILREQPVNFMEPLGEEDMLAVLDRFRNYRDDSKEEGQPMKLDSLVEFGHYLQSLDA